MESHHASHVPRVTTNPWVQCVQSVPPQFPTVINVPIVLNVLPATVDIRSQLLVTVSSYHLEVVVLLNRLQMLLWCLEVITLVLVDWSMLFLLQINLLLLGPWILLIGSLSLHFISKVILLEQLPLLYFQLNYLQINLLSTSTPIILKSSPLLLCQSPVREEC